MTRENYWAPRQVIAVAKVAVQKVVPATVTAVQKVAPATELVKAAPVKAGVRLLAATSANSSSSSSTRTATARLALMKPPNA